MAGIKDNEVLRFFEVVEGEGLSKCKTCLKKMKNNRVSNLKKHLKIVHNINTTPKIKSSESAIASTSKNIHKVNIQVKKNRVLRAYIGLIAEDCTPFNVLTSENMRDIWEPVCKGLKAVDGNPICLNTENCMKAFEKISNYIKNVISSEVKEKLLSLRVDSATESRNIFGISVQFICQGQKQSRNLGMVYLKDTEKCLNNEVLHILTKYGIHLKQIVSVTTDYDETIKLMSCEFEEENVEDCANDDYLEKIELVEKRPELLLGNLPFERYVAHTAQLCVLDVVKSADILKYLLNCRSLIKYLTNTSNGYCEAFEINNVKLPLLDCPSKRGSTYVMLESLKVAKDVIINIESLKIKNENFELDETLWEFIDCYCLALKPLQDIITLFQEEQMNYGNFYGQWLKCQIASEKIVKEASQGLVHKIGCIILESIEKRTTTLMQNKSFVACLYLDPRYRQTLKISERDDAIIYLKALWHKFNDVCITKAVYTHPSTVQYTDPEDTMLHERIFQSSVVNRIDSKIEDLQLPCQSHLIDVLAFWLQYQSSHPEIYPLSDICFAIPATQLTVEGAFPNLKLLLTNYRNHFNQETLENILLVQLNPSFLDAAIDTLPLFQDQVDDAN